MSKIIIGQPCMTPKETVHRWCHYCVQSRSDSDVENCGGHLVYATGKPCPLYPYRMGKGRVPVKMFRQFCLECQGGSAPFVRECEKADCPMHPYRFGKNPNRMGKGYFAQRSDKLRSTPLNGHLGA